MRLRFYMDVWGGCASYQLQHGFMAHTHPTDKSPGSRRIAFDVVVPDSFLMDVDVVVPEVSPPVMVSDRESTA